MAKWEVCSVTMTVRHGKNWETLNDLLASGGWEPFAVTHEAPLTVYHLRRQRSDPKARERSRQMLRDLAAELD